MRNFLQKYFSVLIFLVSCTSVFATHNRAGEITYTHVEGSNFKYEFVITTYTDPESPADRDALVIFWGDGPESFDTLLRESQVIITASIKRNIYKGIHEYAAPNIYTVYMQDPNRVDQILNIDGSVNVPFYLETTLIIPDPLLFGYNSSPILNVMPIDYANVGEIFTHNPGAEDPDGDALRYSLIPPRQDPINDVPGYEYPDEVETTPPCDDIFTIDSLNGDIVWDVPCKPGIYVICIQIVEFRDGDTIGIINRDMQIEVLDNPNHAPEIAAVNDTCVFAGDELIILVNASDPDISQELTLTATGGPFVVPVSQADFFSDPAEAFVTGTFSWETVCEHVRNEFYTVVFKVEDDYGIGVNEFHLTDQESWLIYVIAPPVDSVQAIPLANQIKVTWDDPYVCAGTENFLGFSVWRKIECDTLEFDICDRGLSGYGYDSIAFVENAYEYIDNSVSHGQVYSYRIIAEFGEHSELAPQFVYNQTQSFPSGNACAELKRDVPIINHISVTSTDVAAGTMYIQWYPPLPIELDTIQNPGPYQYILKRYENRDATGTSSVDIATFNSETFTGLTDTSFNDVLLNTLEIQYSYVIDFYTGDGLLGASESASSVYLNSSPADNRSILTWDFNVPWSNFEYVVYKEIPTGSGIFEILDTIDVQNYTDDSLANGVEVCYKVESIGRFTASTLPADTLMNFSQIKCEVPIDVEPPCAPVLIVSNICETDDIIVDPDELKNELIWTNPNSSCADDVIKYYIYYTATNNGQLVLLDSILNGDDTTFTHDNLLSLAGCYYITAVDSFNNASVSSNLVCVDNCADYNLPNVFTPNNDGSNDLYTPILPYRFIDRVDMKIYNRWGGLVFTASDPMLNWNGTEMNTGKALPEGVYYYVCTIYTVTVNGVEQDPRPLKGYIHLIRSEKTQ
ncbi:MAG: gliding motility-associated C-terminal domain-containing protein [Fimbriimonadaceae bacterium]|nr:gliding motility-associated C-terminal domain-containing protein [Chitinophagales bacterium]